MLEFQLDHAITLLWQTPATLRAMLHDLPDAWTQTNNGPDTWSPRDVLGHLIHGEETDWIPRARIILEEGTARPFEPFDRFAQFGRFNDRSMDQLLDAFGQRRRDNLNVLQQMRLTDEQWECRGTHPELGPVTLQQLLATWVVHDLDHLGQIGEVMARQYVEAVGPWRAYLAILTR